MPDGDEVVALLTADDDMTVVVRGHLCLEAMLNVLLERVVPNELTHLQALRFPARVDLAVALGRISPSSRGAWIKVNEIRNLFAHDLRARINSRLADEFVALVELRPAREAGVFLHLGHRDTPRHRIAAGIGNLWADAFNQVMIDQARPSIPPEDEWVLEGR